MGETKRSGQPGYGLAVAGVVVGIATLLLGVLFIVFTSVAGSPTT